MKRMKLSVLAMLMTLAGSVWANNLQVTNTTVMAYQPDAGLARILFDIAWENSWRYTNVNHDAAWVFFKMQKEGATNWSHVKLAGTGLNPAGYSTGTGTGIEMIVPDDGAGVFVRRALPEGSGPVSVSNVRVVWNFVTNGMTRTSKVQVQTLAIEMVSVAEGSFQVGDGSPTVNGQFESGTNGTPFTITNEAYTITLGGGSAESLENNNAAGMLKADDFNDGTSTSLPALFPKGYAAFYCMKYKITQGQYTDFLNLLTATQAGTRYGPFAAWGRYTSIGTNTLGQYTNGAPDRACGNLSWADGTAFADWAGLRPMTELEYEKACRGTNAPVTNEYAWGSVTIVRQTGHVGTDGSGTETASPATANCVCEQVIIGPVRAGIYATTNSTRESAGASYWGIMELSGHLWERVVTVGASEDRSFTGVMGDGTLNATGNANATNWPATGNFCRGGDFWNARGRARVSDRNNMVNTQPARNGLGGFRGVRTAPTGVGP